MIVNSGHNKNILTLVALLVVCSSNAYANFVIESANSPGLYLHSTPREAQMVALDAYGQQRAGFVRRRGFAGRGVSFESIAFPGYFLRHANFRIVLATNDNTELFRQDSTFLIRRATNGQRGVSFESVNFPNHYITMRNSSLHISQPNTPLTRSLASFNMRTIARSQPQPRPYEPPIYQQPSPNPSPSNVPRASDIIGRWASQQEVIIVVETGFQTYAIYYEDNTLHAEFSYDPRQDPPYFGEFRDIRGPVVRYDPSVRIRLLRGGNQMQYSNSLAHIIFDRIQ